MNIRTLATIAALAAAPLTFATSANACSSGFLANLACKAGVISPEQARAADRAHHQMGNPLDRIANEAARARGVPLTPFCVTVQGRFVGPWGPVGTACMVNGIWGARVQ